MHVVVSFYSFNDGTNDEVTNNTGSVVNATKTTGIIRDSYFFNGNGTAGKTQGYITIPNSNVLNISGSEITLSVWIKPNLVQGNEQIIISKNSYLQYKIGYVSSGLFRFTLTNTSSITKDLNTPLTYTNTSMWYHIVGTYNGSIMRLYVNGVEVTNTTFAGNIKGSTSNLVIGCFASSLDRCFNGTIDEVGIWNKAISSSEIKSLYNNARNYDANPSTDFNFRMLSTTTGQFQQPDTIIVDPFNPKNLNRYTFEENSPYNHIDPTGHISCDLDQGCFDTDILGYHVIIGNPTYDEGDLIKENNVVSSQNFETQNQWKADLLIIAGTYATSRDVSSISKNNNNIFKNSQQGRAAETQTLNNMGLTKNTKTFSSIDTKTGKSVNTIPDVFTKDSLYEIKNSKYVSSSPQLRAQNAIATQTKRQPNLVVGKYTKVSSNLEKNWKIIRQKWLGPKK